MVLTSRPDRGRAAFTLVELLVVIGIMAVLATISVAGYSAASRGMADRGVIQTTVSVLRIAKQFCEMERVPTKVLFFNRRFSDGSRGDDAPVYQGTAIAIKQAGRISVPFGANQMLIDEFADFQQSYPELDESELNRNNSPGIRIYRMRSTDQGKTIDDYGMMVKPFVAGYEVRDYMIQADTTVDQWSSNHRQSGNKYVWGFKPAVNNSGMSGNDAWLVGDPYAMEIARIDLPKGYIFGKELPHEDTLESASVSEVYFDPGQLQPKPSKDVPVYAVQRVGSSVTTRQVESVDSTMLKDENVGK